MRFVRMLAFAIAAVAASPSLASEAVKWNGWDSDLFTRATVEKRFVILDLEAVWCHWCHVMEKTTYADLQVKDLLASKYLPVRVDQDANPDLSNRYGDWGWPATIVFGPDGTESPKSGGTLSRTDAGAAQGRDRLSSLCTSRRRGLRGQAVRLGLPDQGTTGDARQELRRYPYEDKIGGWGDSQKYIDADSMDYALSRAEAGDAVATTRARKPLTPPSH